MAEPGACELLGRPRDGRLVERARPVRLGDVDRHGRLRLDATARYLQDIATDDANDAGLGERFGWLMRRTLIRTDAPAVLGEQLRLATWCTGVGRSWAERRTEVRGANGASIDTVSVWVQIDLESGRPAPLTEEFHTAYGEASGGRKVSARLALDATPTADTRHRPWHVRATDLDPYDHVNNAATWAIVEDTIDLGDRIGVAELEYLVPIARDGEHLVRHTDEDIWLLQNGDVAAVARWQSAG